MVTKKIAAPPEVVLRIIDQQAERLRAIKPEDLSRMFRQCHVDTVRLLKPFLSRGDINQLRVVNQRSFSEDQELLLRLLEQMRRDVSEYPHKHLILESLDEANRHAITKTTDSCLSRGLQRVFIVHGHDFLPKSEVARFLEKLELVPVVLHEQHNGGQTILEKFESHASQCVFAIVIMTPDDHGSSISVPDDLRLRSRQNVLLELGFFCGALGRDKVCVLRKGDIEVPSDILGLTYIEIDDRGGWRQELAMEMKAAGIRFDANALL